MALSPLLHCVTLVGTQSILEAGAAFLSTKHFMITTQAHPRTSSFPGKLLQPELENFPLLGSTSPIQFPSLDNLQHHDVILVVKDPNLNTLFKVLPHHNLG